MIVAAGTRAVAGTACLLAPGVVLEAVGAPDRADARVRAVARVLGARYLVHAGIDVLAPGPRVARAGVMVEAAHAVSMLPLALGSGRHRRAALASAAVACAIALLDLREAAR